MIKVFQSSRGRFTVALQLNSGKVTAGFALCGAKDQFVRRVGFHRATGLLNSKPGTRGRLSLGSYHGSDFYNEVANPVFNNLQSIAEQLAQSDDRVCSLIEGIVVPYGDTVQKSLQVAN